MEVRLDLSGLKPAERQRAEEAVMAALRSSLARLFELREDRLKKVFRDLHLPGLFS